jgi:quinol monooxygenase YgiN
MPAVKAVDGCIGVSLMVDRNSGRCIFTSAWQTEAALRAGLELVQPMRTRAEDMFGAIRTAEQWEIVALHRNHHSADGTCVRATWVKVDPGQLDGGIEMYKGSVLPKLEELEGFCSASLMVDRATGRAVSSVSFGSRDAMERNRQTANALKTAKMTEAGAIELDEGEFDLVLAHLRVPELV